LAVVAVWLKFKLRVRLVDFLRMGTSARSFVRALAVTVALATAGSAAMTYTVRPGDTLTGIAHHFAVPVGDLQAANHLTNADAIDAGQTLSIPTAAPVRARPGVLPDALLAHPKRLALRPVFRRWSANYHVSAALVEGLAWMESGWQNNVVSRTGAIGIGQLEPATVAFVCGTLLHTSLNPRVAGDNIRMTARFLRYLLDQTGGNAAFAVGAYYQGLASMRARGPLPETRTYVAGVLGLATSFSPG
jgi:soluble lytic murein transglycosylase-like protein